MVNPSDRQKQFLLYPAPVRGPSVPISLTLKDRQNHNPTLSGWVLVICAFLLERLGFLRSFIWRNAGFGSLARISGFLDNVEPRYDPTVIPLSSDDASPESAVSTEVPAPDPTPTDPTSPSLSISALIESAPVRYSVAHYRSLYTARELTPLAVVNAILPLIRKDTSPPGKHSIAWINVRVDLIIKAAQESTLRYKEGRSLGSLDGIPVAIKDEFDVEGYATTLGSSIVPTDEEHVKTIVDSWSVAKLKEAGAIIMGKMNMVEFGMDTSGSNPTFGTPRNPYNHQYYTGGSSSGSAYAVSAGLVPIAMGTDAGGSIRIPSSFCSVYGLKPTHNRITYLPAINQASSCAVQGPIAADVESLATVFGVVSQPHPSTGFPKIPPSALVNSKSERPRVIGIPEAWFNRASPTVQSLCREMVERLVAEKNYKVVPIEIPFIKEGQKAHGLTMLTYAATAAPSHSNISPTIRILLSLGHTTRATDLLLAQKLRRLLMRHLSWLWHTHPGMVIVTPTTQCAGWPIRSPGELRHGVSDGDRTQESMGYVWMANFCGVPSISVPAGFVVPEGQPNQGAIADTETPGKIPVGLMAMGEWASEPALLQFAADAKRLCKGKECRPPNWVDIIELAKREMEKVSEDKST
ncbi:amidase signature domain-containing protein [Xylaria cf. heliscus]|nr:amidase signature domain-containing protein [Xylaria cf. heliscus]